ADLKAARAQWPRDVERARKLIRLHADEHDHSRAGLLDHARQLFRTDACVGFVERVNGQIDVIAENATLRAIARETLERRERVRWNRGAQPLDDVAVVVVMRRLHEDETELLPGHG